MYNSYKIKKNESHQFIGDVYYIITIKKKQYIEFETIIEEGL
jgi:hypothetical protein